ncbi:MAG TPA: hypothetical protein VH637_21500 [Streptosporangiaceae bacterium]
MRVTRPVFGDDNSAVFRFGAALINLLRTSAAGELIEPAAVAGPAPERGSSSPSASMTWTRSAQTWPAGG